MGLPRVLLALAALAARVAADDQQAAWIADQRDSTGKQGWRAALGSVDVSCQFAARMGTKALVFETADGRFAFINVWRSIDDEHPVLQSPLAVCDENSVPESDRFLYELRFPDRTGENYSLRHSDAHRWYYYPRQTKDECLVFKVYDKKVDGPRFVFHTSFADPSSPTDAPPRKSIEIRAIAFYDSPPL